MNRSPQPPGEVPTTPGLRLRRGRPTIDQAVAIQDQGLFRLRAVSPMSVVLLAGEPPRWR